MVSDVDIRPRRGTKARHREIIALLDQHGALSIAQLAGRFGCSPATIRRDLAVLGKKGLPLQHYHGAVSLTRTNSLGSQIEDRQIERYQEKEAIAQLLIDFISDDTIIGLNGGTTTTMIARALIKAKKRVRVVTNAVNIAYELSINDMDVVIVGGAVRLPNFESTGPLALRTLGDMHVDLGILGAEGTDPYFGFSTTTEEEAAVAQAFRSSSDKILMAIDHSKMGKKALFGLLNWTDVDFVAIDRVDEFPVRGFALPDSSVVASADRATVWKIAPR